MSTITPNTVRSRGLCRDRDNGRQAGMSPMIQRLEEERTSVLDFIERTVSEAQAAGRDLTTSERETLTRSRERVGQLDDQLTPLREFSELRGAHDDTASRYRPGAGTGGDDDGRSLGYTEDRPSEYRTAGQVLADAWRAANPSHAHVGRQSAEAAEARLRSIGRGVVGGMLSVVDADQARSADAFLTRARSESRAAVPHTTTAEVPGLLPTPIVGTVMSDIDAARPFVSSVGAKDLGSIPGTSFERPTVSTHVTVGEQSAEKAELPDGQFVVTGVPFTKDTYGGWTNVSRQAIDWTSPSVWDALLTDFQEIYGIQTENAAADAFVAAVTQETELATALAGTPTAAELFRALYGAARQSYAGSGRMPDMIWASLDWWVELGVLQDTLKATTAGDGGGSSSMSAFAGNLLSVPRVIVPSFPEGTLIVGVRSRTEVYEDRIGFLSAVQPRVLGVELAYGGYMASGTIKPAAFARVVNEA